MKPPIIPSLVAGVSLLLAAACSNDTPPPAPAAQPIAQPAAQPAPQPAAQPAPQKAAVAARAAPDADAGLAERVRKALENEAREMAQGIDVSAKQGVVRLYGTVASGADRGKAGKIAASVSGVSSVDNQLAVVKGS